MCITRYEVGLYPKRTAFDRSDQVRYEVLVTGQGGSNRRVASVCVQVGPRYAPGVLGEQEYDGGNNLIVRCEPSHWVSCQDGLPRCYLIGSTAWIASRNSPAKDPAPTMLQRAPKAV